MAERPGIVWIGGDHPWHLRYINTVTQEFGLRGALIQVREPMLPRPPEGLAPRDRDNFVRRFRERDQAEARYFGDQARPSCQTLEAAPEDLNTERSAEFIRSLAPDLVLVFGCGLIKEDLAGLGPEGHGQEPPLHRLQGRAPAGELRSFRQRPGGPT